MNRRTLLTACPLVLLMGCNSLVSIPVDAKGFADAIVEGLGKYAPPDVYQKMQAAYAALQGGGNWKSNLKALADLAEEMDKAGLIPEPAASYSRLVLGGVRLLLGFAGAVGPDGKPSQAANAVTLEQARGAAEMLRAVK